MPATDTQGSCFSKCVAIQLANKVPKALQERQRAFFSVLYPEFMVEAITMKLRYSRKIKIDQLTTLILNNTKI